MDYISLLKEELRPAFGCTEPIALAYTAAKAVEVLGEFPDTLVVRCSANIIKNVKSVVIPNSGGKKGLVYAAVLGAIVQHSERELEVLEQVSDEDRAKMNALVEGHFCTIELAEGVANLYVEVKAAKGEHSAIVRIEETHTNITYVEKNGEVLLEKPLKVEGKKSEESMSFHDIYTFAKEGKYEEVAPILDMQAEYNLAIAKEGLHTSYGSTIGKLLLMDVENPSLGLLSRARAAAGSDARMSGCPLPVVINSGSGNQGIAVSLPVVTAAELMKTTVEERQRALLFANLIGLYQKAGIGKLSAYCGVVSAAIAGVAGVAFLKGESEELIAESVANGLVSLSGIVCDGAKPSCAGKIAISIEGAYLGYKQAKCNRSYEKGDGLNAFTIDDTIQSIGRLAKDGMRETDIVILQEMLKH